MENFCRDYITGNVPWRFARDINEIELGSDRFFAETVAGFLRSIPYLKVEALGGSIPRLVKFADTE